jgi:hypothetical protein
MFILTFLIVGILIMVDECLAYSPMNHRVRSCCASFSNRAEILERRLG